MTNLSSLQPPRTSKSSQNWPHKAVPSQTQRKKATYTNANTSRHRNNREFFNRISPKRQPSRRADCVEKLRFWRWSANFFALQTDELLMARGSAKLAINRSSVSSDSLKNNPVWLFVMMGFCPKIVIFVMRSFLTIRCQNIPAHFLEEMIQTLFECR